MENKKSLWSMIAILMMAMMSVGFVSCEDKKPTYNYNYNDGGSNPSFRGNTRKCNIASHHCTGLVERTDHYCAVCYNNGFACHAVYH